MNAKCLKNYSPSNDLRRGRGRHNLRADQITVKTNNQTVHEPCRETWSNHDVHQRLQMTIDPHKRTIYMKKADSTSSAGTSGTVRGFLQSSGSISATVPCQPHYAAPAFDSNPPGPPPSSYVVGSTMCALNIAGFLKHAWNTARWKWEKRLSRGSKSHGLALRELMPFEASLLLAQNCGDSPHRPA